MKRVTKNVSADFTRWFASEDGRHYRGKRQDMNPALARVNELNEINQNGGGKNGWRYGGSIPVAFLEEWLSTTGHRMDQFATSKDLRTEFITWMQDRDRRGFIADDGHFAKKHRGVGRVSSSIIVR
jgi:hypothetical protein